MERFELPSRRRRSRDSREDIRVRIDREAHDALMDMQDETGLSLKELTCKAILFAAENVEYIPKEA